MVRAPHPFLSILLWVNGSKGGVQVANKRRPEKNENQSRRNEGHEEEQRTTFVPFVPSWSIFRRSLQGAMRRVKSLSRGVTAELLFGVKRELLISYPFFG